MLLNLVSNLAAGVAQGLKALKLPGAMRALGGAALNPQEAFALAMDSIASKNIVAAVAMGGAFSLASQGFAAGMWYSTMARNTIFPPKPLFKKAGAGRKGPIMTANGPQFE